MYAEKLNKRLFFLRKWDYHFTSIPDVEPPTCSFCPGDIVKEGKSAAVRVLWDRPVCTDNSRLPPIINSNRQSGDLYGVPGTYKIQYIVEDFAYPKGNIYTGCSFTITLKSKLRRTGLHVHFICPCIFDLTYPPRLKRGRNKVENCSHTSQLIDVALSV